MTFDTIILLQADPVSLIEKRTVKHATMLMPTGSVDVRTAWLHEFNSTNTALTPSAVPVGTVEFCRAWMARCDMFEPIPFDFPPTLSPWFGRTIKFFTEYAAAPDGWWVKPFTTKAWDAHIKTRDTSLLSGWVWASEPLSIQAEWRVYVVNGEIVGTGRYDDNDAEIDDMVIEPTALDMVRCFESSGQAPAAYALDVALTDAGEVVLVEVTDAWAIGYYKGSCSPQDYLRMLVIRWNEIIAVGADRR